MPFADELRAMMREWPCPVFVAIDGALLQDAPAIGRKAEVALRSLYIEHRDPKAVLVGPWFAALDDRGIDNLLRIEGIETCAVFWNGVVDEAVIFRHLRSINLADLPRPKDAPFDPFAADPETVIFRHADPAVMTMVLPVLAPAQRARLMGPMASLAVWSSVIPGVREAKRRADWPEPARGRLTLSQVQLDEIDGIMKDRSRQAIGAYLRQVAPGATASMDGPALIRFVAEADLSGRTFGIETERGLGQWAYLLMLTHGKAASMPEVVRGFEASEYVADVTVEHMLMAMVKVFAQRALGA